MGSPAQNITRHYGGDWTGNQGAFPSPGHSKSDRGMTIKDADGGDVLIYSHNGGDWQSVKAECRRLGLIPDRAANDDRRRTRDVASWDYHDANGKVAFRKVRMALAGGDKSYRIEHPDGRGGWAKGRGSADPVPYRLPDLIAAAPDASLFMAEGEKQADKLASWGLLATSLRDWRRDYEEYVAGRRVVLLPDNDEPGAVIAEKARALIAAAGGKPVVIELPGLPAKGDVMDWNGDRATLERLVTETIVANKPGAIRATPFIWRDPATIPARRFIYGKHLIRGFVSVDVAAAGIGKSSLKIAEALSIASGLDIYGKGLPEGALRVWSINLEDPRDELERRLHATASRFAITPDMIGERLFVDSGRDQPVVIATEGRDGAVIVRPVVDALIAEMQARKIDLLQLDPFISSHAVSENDNGAIDMVAREWNVIAERTGAAVNLVHHVRKGNGADATADSARGASALIGKARSVVVFNRMAREEAERLGVAEFDRRFLFRVDTDKANLAPPDEAAWYRMQNVDLPNGDGVGVAEQWTPPDAFAGISVDDLLRVQRAVDTGEWRKDVQATAWVGQAVASVLNLDADAKSDQARIKSLLRTWIANGALTVVIGKDSKAMKRQFVEVGHWANDDVSTPSNVGCGEVGKPP